MVKQLYCNKRYFLLLTHFVVYGILFCNHFSVLLAAIQLLGRVVQYQFFIYTLPPINSLG